ncbi:NAD-dependent protein deacylase [Anaerosporobacter faecicola]|uniref:NAD-dependent protein deacylase n=1 Tax=Anaerosporobacter faecicola TaxID=2718714 RepID=UPI00143BBE7D|nr:NAD-dependent protein deacylase [Anaerosporobacter faecicola]
MNNKIEQFVTILQSSNNIVFFGGAGVSTESGIPDFRSSNGLYSKKLNQSFTPEQAVSHTFFIQHPEEFYDFYKQNLIYPDAKPNNCHYALAKLEKMGKLKAVVTQNIDGLHQGAGSKVVYELHGSVLRNYCTQCNAFYDVDYVLNTNGIPHCKKCNGIVKPDVVLYEEGLDDEIIENAIHAIATADTLIIGGTSLVVYPAAGLINYFQGKNLVLINKSVTSADQKANLVINDNIGVVMKEAVEKLYETGR